MENIVISFNGLEPSDALKQYVEEKLTKHEDLLLPATSIRAELNEFKSTRGVKADFRFDLNVTLPKAVVRVEESGNDMYAIIDKATDVLARRLKRYLDKRSNWDGITPWSDLESQLDESLNSESSETDEYIDYVPKVSVRKKLDYLSPMHEAEAIERMELLGDNQILFKSAISGKYTMIYKDNRGRYILIEPADTL